MKEVFEMCPVAVYRRTADIPVIIEVELFSLMQEEILKQVGIKIPAYIVDARRQ